MHQGSKNSFLFSMGMFKVQDEFECFDINDGGRK